MKDRMRPPPIQTVLQMYEINSMKGMRGKDADLTWELSGDYMTKGAEARTPQ